MFRLLIVDDEVDITDALKTGLESHGFTVDAYNDPMDALANFKPMAYDLAVLDIRMPKMNGFELCRQLRKIDENIHVAFFTAFDVYQAEFDKMFPDVKAVGFIKKPMSLAHLMTRLNVILTVA